MEKIKADVFILGAGAGGTEVEAKVFADCTGNIILARCASCDHTIGSEGAEDYGGRCCASNSQCL